MDSTAMELRFDVVLAKYSNIDKVYAFKAPSWSGIEEGEVIVVDNDDCEEKLTVVGKKVFNLEYEKDDYEFLCKAVDASEPLKRVKAKIVRKDISYADED